MSPVILEEVRLFLLSICAGFFLALLYEILRVFRRLLPHGMLLRSVEDFLYWIFCGMFTFLLLFRENNGILRGFALGGIVLGMFWQDKVVYPFISRIIRSFFNKKY